VGVARCAHQGICTLARLSMSVLTRRVANFQPFLRSTERDDGTSVGAQYGFVTYDQDDNYRVSHFEVGFRCDHLHDALGPDDVTRRFDSPLPCDADLMRKDPSAIKPLPVLGN